MGGSGGKSETSSSWGNVLGAIAQQVNKEADPTRRALFNQMNQLLQGHLYGPGTIPLIQSGVGAARRAGGQALAATQANLAQSGGADSPFAAAIRGQLAAQVGQNISNVPINIAQSFLSAAPGMVTGVGGQAMQGLASAGQLNQTTTQGMGWGQLAAAGGGALI